MTDEQIEMNKLVQSIIDLVKLSPLDIEPRGASILEAFCCYMLNAYGATQGLEVLKELGFHKHEYLERIVSVACLLKDKGVVR